MRVNEYPAVACLVFEVDEFVHNVRFVLLKPSHLTGLPEHCSFVGLFVARSHRGSCAQSDSLSDVSIIANE